MKARRREGFHTAKDIALQRSHNTLVYILEPEIYHNIRPDALSTTEKRVHESMREIAGVAVGALPFFQPIRSEM